MTTRYQITEIATGARVGGPYLDLHRAWRRATHWNLEAPGTRYTVRPVEVPS